MVDVTPKDPTHRRAVSRCKVFMTPETTTLVASNAITKGDVLGAARIAGIQAAKRASDLIPLCHPLLVGAVTINFTLGEDHVEIETQVETVDRTGVEMEAMTACAVAALTIYDMCKSADRSMVIGELALWEKTGGRRGHWRRPGPPPGSRFEDRGTVGRLSPAIPSGDGLSDGGLSEDGLSEDRLSEGGPGAEDLDLLDDDSLA